MMTTRVCRSRNIEEVGRCPYFKYLQEGRGRIVASAVKTAVAMACATMFSAGLATIAEQSDSWAGDRQLSIIRR